MNYELLRKNKELWDLFTRKEEYNSIKLEKNDKFIYDYASRKDIMDPSVSRFLIDHNLWIEYPDNKKFAICLTHDVDDIYPSITRSILFSLCSIKDLNFETTKNHLIWRIYGKKCSPYRNFKYIIELEKRYNAKSSFYFISNTEDTQILNYHIDDLENDLGFIRDNGWEVGLHGGYYSYANLDKIEKEKKAIERLLGKKIIGYRNHGLMFKVPVTWELLARAGFKYDTTLGYDHMVGFRNGMCHPFIPFNLETERSIGIWELPLNIIDFSLKSLKLDFNASFNVIKILIDIVEKYRGVLVLCWHNNMFNCPYRYSFYKLYKKILKYSIEKNACLTSGEEILRYLNVN